ncbi:MAG TPA: MmcQ/YjbR family DNA-binding protein [Acidisarcina sp.]
MDAERVRGALLKLPLVVETMQWGDNLVYWVGDKAVGGKMFALVNLDQAGHGSGPALVMSFWVGPERFAELVERESVVPAPYMARIYWIALEGWNALPSGELISLLKDAREATYQKLPQRTKDVLALPSKDLSNLVAERRKLLAVKTKGKGSQRAG